MIWNFAYLIFYKLLLLLQRIAVSKSPSYITIVFFCLVPSDCGSSSGSYKSETNVTFYFSMAERNLLVLEGWNSSTAYNFISIYIKFLQLLQNGVHPFLQSLYSSLIFFTKYPSLDFVPFMHGCCKIHVVLYLLNKKKVEKKIKFFGAWYIVRDFLS